ncbi:hypothetical protein ACI798_19850 [Geodermatophilus sp. SYSU D01045]
MSIGEFFRMVVRWKWVIVPGLLLALGAGAFVYQRGEPDYTRTASYLLLTPVQTESGESNPLLFLGNGVTITASVLAAKVSDSETVEQLTAAEPGVTYTAVLDAAVGAPVVQTSVTGPDAQAVDRVLAALGDELGAELEALQRESEAPENTWVTLHSFTQDPQAVPSSAGPLRNAIAATGAAVLLLFLVVGVLERRRRLREARLAPASAAHDGGTGLNTGPTRRVSGDRGQLPPVPDTGETRARGLARISSVDGR